MKREFLRKIIVVGMTTLIVSSLNYMPASAKWISDSNNSWNWTEDGIKATGWKNIDNKWYYFNENGIMLTGWIKYSQNWYSLSNDGTMDTGWKNISGKWYHFDADGKMSTGWINDNGNRYFMESSGEMVTGSLNIDGIVYNFSDNGQLIKDENSDKENQSEPPVAQDSTTSGAKPRIAYVTTNSDSLNVRAEATTSSDIIGKLAKGIQVSIIDDAKDGFYPLMLNGRKGWVSSDWISFKENDNSTTSNSISPNGDSSGSSNVNSSDTSTSASNSNDNKSNDDNKSDDNNNKSDGNNNDKNVKEVSLGGIRTTEPSLNSKYYYSDDNIFYKVKLSPPFYSGGSQIKGNCTWYAWGRAWEITGTKPTDAGFIGNAYEWWNANKNSGKYQYGSEPRIGAIAVWKSGLPNSGGSGHVAVVEKIDNGKVYISESTWNGVTFRYRDLYETDYLYGYIYLDKPNY
ncbi:CHAP domain-containing protein [Clostridium sp. BL-8]|uniref:CHAP domain-containing protein n=1 Tax=Clostridium sp. BL-8 TaxID=349938 RepID=UPI00098C284B|nr:CHAP domain-containing protein [Clostridium sp. BL-8]OOM76797.1 autolysin [Clostridium sp. BL-8]